MTHCMGVGYIGTVGRIRAVTKDDCLARAIEGGGGIETCLQ